MLASPLIVADMLLKADVFRFNSSEARLDLDASGGGEPARSAVEPLLCVVGGRCDTQS